jgi:hypothetical protein
MEKQIENFRVQAIIFEYEQIDMPKRLRVAKNVFVTSQWLWVQTLQSYVNYFLRVELKLLVQG